MTQSLPAQRIVAADIGLGLALETERLRRIDQRDRVRLAVDQPVQEIEDMGLGGNARLKRHLDGAQHRLLVVVQHQGKDVDHLPIAASAPEQQGLQTSETHPASR